MSTRTERAHPFCPDTGFALSWVGMFVIWFVGSCANAGQADRHAGATTIEREDAPSNAKRHHEDTSPDPELQRFEYTQMHMGVQAHLVLYDTEEPTAKRGAQAVFDRIAELDAAMSDYREDSELMKWVRRAGEGPVAISRDLFHVLQTAQRLARQSEGAFDVTAGPLVHLWREARAEQRLPSRSALEEARSRSHYRFLQLSPEDTTATLTKRPMRIDLGGIAKGYAADEAMAMLKAHDIEHALIEFGGDMVVGKPPPGKKGWSIEDALTGHTMSLSEIAVSTSGDTYQFVGIEGIRYSHVIDPRTGMGLTNHTGVTVIAPEGILADGLATTLSVLGPKHGKRLIRNHYPHVQTFFGTPAPPAPEVRPDPSQQSNAGTR